MQVIVNVVASITKELVLFLLGYKLHCGIQTTPARPCLRQSYSHSPETQHPPGSRTRNERCFQVGPTPNLHRQSDIETHKKAISCHWHAWAQANTPPGYWEIGFPDTQAVGNINEKAEQMHKKKKAEIDKEAGNKSRAVKTSVKVTTSSPNKLPRSATDDGIENQDVDKPSPAKSLALIEKSYAEHMRGNALEWRLWATLGWQNSAFISDGYVMQYYPL